MKSSKFYTIILVLVIVGLISSSCSATSQTTVPEQVGSLTSEESVKPTDQPQLMRTVQDANGKVDIPSNPQRIVDLAGVVDALLYLGHKPIATTSTYNNEISSLLKEQLPNTLPIDLLNHSFEQIADMNPDLIIIYSIQMEEYDSLAKIAPTVVLPMSDGWEDLEMVGNIFDSKDRMEAWIADFKEKANQLHNEIMAKTGQETYALIELRGKTMNMHDESFGPGVLFFKELGLPLPKGASAAEQVKTGNEVSKEGLLAYNPDHIFITGPEGFKQDLEKEPLWKSLKAYTNDHIYYLDEEAYQTYGYGPFGWGNLLPIIKEDILGKTDRT